MAKLMLLAMIELGAVGTENQAKIDEVKRLVMENQDRYRAILADRAKFKDFLEQHKALLPPEALEKYQEWLQENP